MHIAYKKCDLYTLFGGLSIEAPQIYIYKLFHRAQIII